MGLFGGSKSTTIQTTEQNQLYQSLDQAASTGASNVMMRDGNGAQITQSYAPVTIFKASDGGMLGTDAIGKYTDLQKSNNTTLTSSGLTGSLSDLIGLTSQQLWIIGGVIVAFFVLKMFITK